MHKAEVEIFSDLTNAAIMRHPGRHFPGLVLQGDTLRAICRELDEACDLVGRGQRGFTECNKVRNTFWSYLRHYQEVLIEHKMPLPFSD
jgi:hypothetical protein